jgi:molecular chaperone DnaK
MYGFDEKAEHNILVYDLEGGTFEVSRLTIDNGVSEVVAANGDPHLGGEGFDPRVWQHFMKVVLKEHGKDMSKDTHAVRKLLHVVKNKQALSSTRPGLVGIKLLFEGVGFSEVLAKLPQA